MKSWIDKVFAENKGDGHIYSYNKGQINVSVTFILEFLFLLVPFVLWIFCFRYFFTGHLPLFADAISYADHIRFYTDNLSKGVFPLWDPTWYCGAPNDFFLRRIGDVNPFLFLIMLLKWIGTPSATAYLVFIGFYYFLAGWAMYLITRFLLADRFFAFIAYILFLFSSWGSEIFYNYIVIIFLPIIWFFYFLLCFSHRQQKGYFLGMCVCVGLIVTTYIPFLFFIILILFAFLYLLLYGRSSIAFVRHSLSFFNGNKIFTAFCIVFLLISCVPALMFYKESKTGEFVLPIRHSGAGDSSSAVAVGLENAAEGDIISHGYFDRLFDDQAHIDMGDIYIPYLFFLILLISIPARVNKLIFFLLFNILGLSIVTITSAAGVHRFLYDHIIFFKFIRQIYYFFWLAILPIAILLSVVAFKSLLTALQASSRKMAWFTYIVICHLLFAFFIWGRLGVLSGAWVAIFISLLYFSIYIRCDRKVSYPAGFCLILLAVFFQSAQVYACLDQKLFETVKISQIYVQTHQTDKPQRIELYYATHWYNILQDYMEPSVLEAYTNHPFILYDNVVPYMDSPQFLKIFETTAAANNNIAYVSKFESRPDDWQNDPTAAPQPDTAPVSSGKLSILRTDANTWVLKVHLPVRQFLVVNDNYTSGWHAFINGHPARLLRANVTFKGLWLPSGESTVVLRFMTPKAYMLRFALILFFAGIFVYLFLLLKKEKNGPIHV